MQSELCMQILIKNMYSRINKEHDKNNEKIDKICSLLQSLESDGLFYNALHNKFSVLSNSNKNKQQILEYISFNYYLNLNKKSPLCDLNTRPSHYKCDALTN